MSKTKPKRRSIHAGIPKFWRPKLDEGTKLEAKLTHHQLLVNLEGPTPTTDDLWDWMETGFTYSQMFRLLWQDGELLTTEAEAAIAAQLNTYPAICARLRKWRKVQLTQQELEIARTATQVFDGLLDLDRHGIAVASAHWSIEQMGRIKRLYP